MLNKFKNISGGLQGYLQSGAFYTIGGEITQLNPLSIDYGGFENTWGPKGLVRTPKPGWKPGAGMLLGAATSVPFWLIGYADGGAWGAINAMTSDIATSAALTRWGHNKIKIAGVDTVVAGRYWGQQAINNIGKSRYLGMAANGLNLGIRGLWGAAGHAAATSVFGNGILGNTLGIAGAAVGVRASPYLTAGAAVGAGVGMLGYAGYSLAQAGYNHAIMRKQVQTAGDMSSFMTTGATTMRARAVEAIQRSHLNTRSALGQEATYMHNSNNYFSPYRG